MTSERKPIEVRSMEEAASQVQELASTEFLPFKVIEANIFTDSGRFQFLKKGGNNGIKEIGHLEVSEVVHPETVEVITREKYALVYLTELFLKSILADDNIQAQLAVLS